MSEEVSQELVYMPDDRPAGRLGSGGVPDLVPPMLKLGPKWKKKKNHG